MSSEPQPRAVCSHQGTPLLPDLGGWAGDLGRTAAPGFVFNNPVGLHLVEDGLVRRVPYERVRFDYGRLSVPANSRIWFSGFKLLSTFGNGQPVEFATVQGATFFRAVARGQTYGAVARALTLKPAETRGEEFPVFRAFWLERPAPGSNAITVHGIVDSESTAGAVRMTFRPGEMTIADVETTLFPRVNLEHVGVGGMGSTYLFGPNDRRNIDDVRPGVYESTGLQMLNGRGEWLWRPLQNPETLQISAFVDATPRGFGLLQRERSYEAFQDDEQRYERRPSLWIEPLGDWGPGSVQLLEIPSDAEINDNVLAYWRPRAPFAAGAEVSLAYRQYWCWHAPERPPFAAVSMTRVGRGSAGAAVAVFRRFQRRHARRQPARGSETGSDRCTRVGPEPPGLVLPGPAIVRVAFELDPATKTRVRCVLSSKSGKPISETWLYRWTP